jgi:hypothetical protein
MFEKSEPRAVLFVSSTVDPCFNITQCHSLVKAAHLRPFFWSMWWQPMRKTLQLFTHSNWDSNSNPRERKPSAILPPMSFIFVMGLIYMYMLQLQMFIYRMCYSHEPVIIQAMNIRCKKVWIDVLLKSTGFICVLHLMRKELAPEEWIIDISKYVSLTCCSECVWSSLPAFKYLKLCVEW